MPVGCIHYRDMEGREGARYFLVAAGVGAEALLMSRMDARLKRKLGYILYVAEAVRIWATISFRFSTPPFASRTNGRPRICWISQLLAVRVRSFGEPGSLLAMVRNETLQLMAFKTQNRLRFLKFFLAAPLRRIPSTAPLNSWTRLRWNAARAAVQRRSSLRPTVRYWKNCRYASRL